MSDRTETLLRDVFAADAENAPVPRNLAAAARQRVSHRRRRLAVVGAAMTVVVALAIGVGALTLPRSERSLPADRGWTGPTHVVAFHGVEVTLPASIQESRCGKQVGIVVVGPMQFGSCGANSRIPIIRTVVWLTSTGQPGDVAGDVTGVRTLGDGRTEQTILMPDRAARLVITSPDAGLVLRISASVRLRDIQDGCPLQDDIGLPPRDPQATGPLYSAADFTGGSACAYDNGWVVGGKLLTKTDVRRLVGAANEAPNGFGRPWDCATAGSRADGRGEPHWLALLHRASGTSRLHVAGGQCAPSTVSNDSGHYTIPTSALVTLFGRWAPAPAGMPAGYQDASTPDLLCTGTVQAGQTVVTAYTTTVGEVRRWAEGHALAPTAKPWARLKRETQAAWCELQTTSGYVVIAAAYDQPSVHMITSKTLTLQPDGPQNQKR